MGEDNKSNFSLIAIVAIVAIVGLVVMFKDGGSSLNQSNSHEKKVTEKIEILNSMPEDLAQIIKEGKQDGAQNTVGNAKYRYGACARECANLGSSIGWGYVANFQWIAGSGEMDNCPGGVHVSSNTIVENSVTVFDEICVCCLAY